MYSHTFRRVLQRVLEFYLRALPMTLRRMIRLDGECLHCGTWVSRGHIYCDCRGSDRKASPSIYQSWLENTRGMDDPKVWRSDFDEEPAVALAMDNKNVKLMVWRNKDTRHFSTWARNYGKGAHMPNIRHELMRSGFPEEIIKQIISPLGNEEIKNGDLHSINCEIVALI